MSKYTVENYEMSGGEIDTFHKLFWFGSQDDGDLPSKSGMAALIKKGLAVKNYELPKLCPSERPNGLSIKGAEVAQSYYKKKSDTLTAHNQKYRGALESVYDDLMNLQPHIPEACYPNRQTFIDAHIDKAMKTLRETLKQ